MTPGLWEQGAGVAGVAIGGAWEAGACAGHGAGRVSCEEPVCELAWGSGPQTASGLESQIEAGARDTAGREPEWGAAGGGVRARAVPKGPRRVEAGGGRGGAQYTGTPATRRPGAGRISAAASAVKARRRCRQRLRGSGWGQGQRTDV